MPFLPAERVRVLFGSLGLTGYTRDVSVESTADMLDVTCHGTGTGVTNQARAFIPGQETSTFSAAGPLDTDTTAGGQAAVLQANKAATTPTPLTYALSGQSVGATAYLMQTNEATYSNESQHDGTVDWSLEGQTDGAFDFGVFLEDGGTAITADGNGTARDNTAATANGGVGQMHVTAFSGFTNNIVTIEHSVDGSTAWATLVTFATYTGLTSERVVVAPGTTVRRYLRVVDNVTGTGSTSRAVLFARR